MSWTVQRYDDPVAFYEAMCGAFADDEVAHSLALGTARFFAEQGKAPEGGPLLAVLDASSSPVATALRLPPYDFQISAVDEAAVEALADAVIDTGAALPGVIGPAPLSLRFAARVAEKTGRPPELRHEMPLYKLGALVPPTDPPPGRLRPAEAADHDWLIDMLIAFAVEAGLPEHERGQQHITAQLAPAIEKGRVFVWELPDGRKTATAGYNLTGITGGRIGRVMTIPAERGRGVASAVVASLSRHILDGGIAGWCGLFADAKNPQSNRIYQRLGYGEVCRYRSIRLD